MITEDFSLLTSNYEQPQKTDWSGRPTNPEIGKQYWHQHIEFSDLNSMEEASVKDNRHIGLLGYACDEGVRRNLGRIGAKHGPYACRQQLAKLAYHTPEKTVFDFGNVVCSDHEMEACQDNLRKAVSALLRSSIFPIIIGGGHDITYGHFKGVREALINTSKPKIGIINFDAHFDLRPLEDQPSSGTPFYQILTEYPETTQYFALGIQEQSNTKELFNIAEAKNVDFLLNYECEVSNFEFIKSRLSDFVDKNDWLYVTLDMDGFASSYAPGVSAPSPLGFTPYFVLKTLKFLLDTKKVMSFDIAEINPEYDKDNLTANLAARIIDFVVANN